MRGGFLPACSVYTSQRCSQWRRRWLQCRKWQASHVEELAWSSNNRTHVAHFARRRRTAIYTAPPKPVVPVHHRRLLHQLQSYHVRRATRQPGPPLMNRPSGRSATTIVAAQAWALSAVLTSSRAQASAQHGDLTVSLCSLFPAGSELPNALAGSKGLRLLQSWKHSRSILSFVSRPQLPQLVLDQRYYVLHSTMSSTRPRTAQTLACDVDKAGLDQA